MKAISRRPALAQGLHMRSLFIKGLKAGLASKSSIDAPASHVVRFGALFDASGVGHGGSTADA